MTQENILVSPRLSACLKPGSLFRFVANPGASPGLRPSDLGDTRAHVAQICQSARPTLSTLCAHAGATPNRASVLECGSLYRFSTAPVTSLTVTPPRRFPCPLPIAHCPLPIAHCPSPIAPNPNQPCAISAYPCFQSWRLHTPTYCFAPRISPPWYRICTANPNFFSARNNESKMNQKLTLNRIEL
jgi:hypothetical protein